MQGDVPKHWIPPCFSDTFSAMATQFPRSLLLVCLCLHPPRPPPSAASFWDSPSRHLTFAGQGTRRLFFACCNLKGKFSHCFKQTPGFITLHPSTAMIDILRMTQQGIPASLCISNSPLVPEAQNFYIALPHPQNTQMALIETRNDP